MLESFYQLLGVPSSATQDEIRRAYRILARRYHPDVNPGRGSEEKFKAIAEAYQVLSNEAERRSYDAKLQTAETRQTDARVRAYQAQQRAQQRAQRARGSVEAERTRAFKAAKAQTARKARPKSPLTDIAAKFQTLRGRFSQALGNRLKNVAETHSGVATVSKISIIEVSIALSDALRGVKKTIEIAEPEGSRKVSVKIPPGVRSGHVVRMRAAGGHSEELVLIVRVASLPSLHLEPRGLVMDLPVTVSEAISGATIKAPGIDEPQMVRIPPATQSGAEVRVKGKGIVERDGTRSDLIYRVLIQLPESSDAIGLKEKGQEITQYYGTPVRHNLPDTVWELLR